MRIAFILAILLLGFQAFSQIPVFTGKPVSLRSEEALQAQFGEYAVFQIDIPALNAFVKGEAGTRSFRLEPGARHDWDLHVEPFDIRAPGYQLRIATEDGVVATPPAENKTFRGQRGQDPLQRVSLTIDHEFLYGFVEEGEETYFIEPLRYFLANAAPDQFLLYPASKVIQLEGKTCGVDELRHRKSEYQAEKPADMPETGNCYRVELAIASDWLMHQAYGSAGAVENHNIGVMNNVAANWDDEFSDEINFLIVEQFVSSCSTCDPWTSSTNANTLLQDFTDWGPTGFNATHDVGQMWTHRDFDGPTIGIAWLASVCSSDRYHLLSDFGSNADLKRVMTAHEIGHNFDAVHDPSGSPYIMAPAVQNTTIWSALSQIDINAFILQVDPPDGCLSFCPPPLPPTPAFTANITNLCPGSFVSFFDESSNQPSSWNWSMPGASPSSSTQQSPTVVYNNPGAYNVTLTVANSNGSNSLTKTGYIVVTPSGGTDFFFFEGFENGPGSWLVQNPDNGIAWTSATVNGTRQGSKAMMLDNFNYPVVGQRDGLVSPAFSLFGRENAVLEIEYAYTRYNASRRDSLIVFISTNGGGSYTRLFAATEDGNGNFATKTDQITAFNPQSANEWCFGPGGPDCLSLDLSAYAGFTNCRIRIENYTGRGNRMYIDNVRIMSECENFVPPVVNFTATPTDGCAALQVNFQDLSTNSPASWNWSFPGAIPTSSTLQDPVVLYPVPGVYTVTLTATNPAGSNTLTKTEYIVAGGPPTAGFSFAVAGYSASFINTSSANASSWSWDFGDGATSSLQDPPPHAYEEDGVYEVTLIADSGCGTSTWTDTVVISNPPLAGFSANPASGCVPLTVYFTNESTSNAETFSWSFPGGDPAASTEENPVVVYSDDGVYQAILITSNGNGNDTLIRMAAVEVGLPSQAGFSVVVTGDTAVFANVSENADAYHWDFGDGAASTDSDPVHVYTQSGSYEVTLTAFGVCDTATAVQTVEVVLAPVAGFIASDTSGCASLTVQFTDQSENTPTGWFWSFEGGDPATSTDPDPVVTYLQAGAFGVTLIATNGAGSDTLTLSGYVEAAAGPVAGFNTEVDGTVATFTNTSSNALSHFWDFGDGNVSEESDPVHTFAAAGSYEVTLIATNGCGSDTMVADVAVLLPPTAAFSANPEAGCAPLTVSFENLSSNDAESFGWHFPGGNPATSDAFEPIVEYAQPGLYDVVLIAFSASGGSDTLSLPAAVEVLPFPEAGFTYEVLNGGEVVFENTSAHADAYAWDFGDGNESTAAEPVHTYAETGAFTVVLTAEGPCGSDTYSLEVVIEAVVPTAAFSATPLGGCVPLTVQFTDETYGNPSQWNWSFPGGSPPVSSEQHPVVSYESAGPYTVTLQVANVAGSDVLEQSEYIVAADVPEAGFSYEVQPDGATVVFTNHTLGADAFHWDFGDGDTSLLHSPTHVFDGGGDYTVVLTATNACGAGEDAEVILISSSLDIGVGEHLWIYPNPNTGQFSVRITAPLRSNELVQLRLISALGQVWFQEETALLQGELLFSVNRPDLASGLYWLTVQIGDRQTGSMVVVE